MEGVWRVDIKRNLLVGRVEEGTKCVLGGIWGWCMESLV